LSLGQIVGRVNLWKVEEGQQVVLLLGQALADFFLLPSLGGIRWSGSSEELREAGFEEITTMLLLRRLQV
jgi:hypothetical protein